MEALAFVEVVDRHKDVLARHPVYRWPVRIGRGYDADVIVDDPFVAPVHLAIEPAADGRFTVSDLGSVNGISVAPSEARVDTAEVGCDDLVRLGHTQVRVRTPSYPVPQERPLRAIALYRRPAAFLAVAALTLALFAWNGWIMTIDDDERYAMLFPILAIVAVIAVWISIWSFVSSAVGRRPNFAAHGFVACAGVIALLVAAGLFEYLSFGLDAAWVDYLGIVAIATILASVVYRHLRLNSRGMRRSLVLASTGISIGLCTAMAGITFAIELTQDATQSYSDSIKAPAFLFVPGTSLEAFMSEADALKRKVDVMRKGDTKK